jgi:hypothetical protein
MSLERKSWIDDAVSILNSFNSFLKENPNFLESIKEQSRAWPENQKNMWSVVAQTGWYFNWCTHVSIVTALGGGSKELDDFMISHLTEDWDKITTRIIQFYPHRKHVLEVAFQLHKDKIYVASVPLFFSQVDGICKDDLGQFLFTDRKDRQKEIRRIIENSDSLSTNILLEILSSETSFSASIAKANKHLAPNRHGILHGSKEHLDYGTEKNSFKSFSLLAFVVYYFNRGK